MTHVIRETSQTVNIVHQGEDRVLAQISTVYTGSPKILAVAPRG